jgi:OFA family oxalate/formate antiporter-like MFS transporter
MSAIACGFLPRGFPIRFGLALTGVLVCAGTLLMPSIASAAMGYLAAGLFGAGIGGVLVLLPVAWADYFGRANYGAIRGLALSAQVLAQATGPLASGALYDWTGAYTEAFYCFAVLAALSAVAALAAKKPHGDA